MALKKSQEDIEYENVTAGSAVKKSYSEPTIMVYGTIRGLTAAGTGKQSESGNDGKGGSNSNDPKKRL